MNKLPTAGKPNRKRGNSWGERGVTEHVVCQQHVSSAPWANSGLRKRGRGKGEGSPPTSAKMSLDDEQIKLPKNEHET